MSLLELAFDVFIAVETDNALYLGHVSRPQPTQTLRQMDRFAGQSISPGTILQKPAQKGRANTDPLDSITPVRDTSNLQMSSIR